ncbi:MAG TPA: TIGR00725 family protein, partial [Candidatus Edwardsbacteria bacterium]|nr:TIGR00725 family protein [Candidatus Edwardsbacteria bacterium]
MASAERPLRVGVIGTASCTAKQAMQAEQVGRAIAEAGAVLICGGMGGVMEAACRGAKSAGGITIGVLPGDSAAQSNEYVSIPIVTGMGYARNALVVKTCQAVIAIGGRYGTLSEIAYAAQFGIPIIGLGTWKIRAPIKHVRTPAEAVKLALKLA